MIDADTIVHPSCPNFFELTDNKFTGVHCDASYDWVIRSLENILNMHLGVLCLNSITILIVVLWL